jgi:hypothetical protein
MLDLKCRIRGLSQIMFLLAMMANSWEPVWAQFLPNKGITISHWKEPVTGYAFSEYYWLNSKELVFKQYTAPPAQYVKWNVATGTTQLLEGFTKLLSDSVPAPNALPLIYPSPDGRYIAWKITGNLGSDTIVLAKADGSVIGQHLCSNRIRDLSWSPDSKWCFGIHIQKGAAEFPNFTVVAEISAVNMQMLAAVQNYRLEIDGLSGFQKLDNPLFPDFYFNTSSRIVLVSPQVRERSHSPGTYVSTVRFEEYDLRMPAKPAAVYSIDLPQNLRFDHIVFAPQGNMIAWSLIDGNNTEIWISDGNGKHMERIGKLFGSGADEFSLSGIVWLPNGKEISFRDAGELYVVHLNAHLRLN